jgi:hypothetical protein
VIVSDNLRAVLRYEGYAKLAHATMRARGEYAGDITGVVGAVKSLAVKIATNLENEKIVDDGLYSLRRLQEL